MHVISLQQRRQARPHIHNNLDPDQRNQEANTLHTQPSRRHILPKNAVVGFSLVISIFCSEKLTVEKYLTGSFIQ